MSLPVTEDTPPDMLAGSMDLNVVLPNGKNVKMSIQRSTPMMDLLVQVTTAHRLSPGNYSIQAVGDRGVLPYKPSTPIGILDAFTIKIVDKKVNIHKKAPQVPQSFLNTFRLQVNLPRSQLFVARVTPDITLAEILTHVCTEKNLDINKYEFRIPGNTNEPLELSRTLGSYKVQELSLVNKYNRAVGGLLSSADILHVKSSKHRQSSMCDSSLSSGSLGSRSTSPVPVNLARVPPQPPIRKKRRPAPKPPQLNENESKEEMKTSRQALISHSRESSDSSGYHEASVLSESPTHGVPLRQSEMSNQPDTLPRQSKLPPSQSFTNLVTIQPGARMRLVNSVSNASLNSNGISRKKRAAPPPPTTYPAVEERMKSSTLPTSRAEERIISNVPFVPAENSNKVDLVEEANTKVEIVENSVESESNLIIETKVEVGTSKSDAKSGLGKANANEINHFVHSNRIDFIGVKGENEKWKRMNYAMHKKLMKEMEIKFEDVRKKNLDLPPGYFTPTEREEGITHSRPEIAEKPVPKLRTLLDRSYREKKLSISRRHTDSGTLSSVDGNEKNFCDGNNFEVRGDKSSSEKMKIVKSAPKMGLEDGGYFARLERWRNIDTLACLTEDETKATKTAWLMEDSEASGDVSSVEETEHDSLNWQYQLPPPPTDFRDTHSPSFTDFGAVTITPDIYKEEADKESDVTDSQTNELKDCVNIEEKGNEDKDGLRFLQKKTNVMCELTNVLMDNWKAKEKSSSVTNLYVNDNKKVSSLSYSKSFTSEIPTKNFKISSYDTFGAENETYDNEIKYKNYKNLEKSLSMECIQMRGREEPENKTEDALRKFIPPVQKKMKVAKRSSSTMGYNKPEQRKSESDLDFDVDADNIAVLRQHFLDFLKEKKLTNDLNMKSLTVMRHILPQINGQGCNNNNNEKKESRPNVTPGSVKVVDFKRKANILFDNEIKENVVIIEKDMQKDAEVKREQEIKKAEPVKRYSYHAPPSINFATWGERPKTQVFIKDEDYVTEEKVTKKMEKKLVEEIPKPAVLKKPSTLQFKKPGVKSHYEMFSALPKKKEVTSLTLIQMEDEEKRRKQMEAKEPSRVPVVCGVELKKEFREQGGGNKSISVTEVKIQPELKPSHSVSIYINSDQKKEAVTNSNMAPPKPSVSNFSIQRKTPLMPVVKGFRTFSPVQNRLTHNEFCNGGINNISSNLSSSNSSASSRNINNNNNMNMNNKYSNNGVSIINESNVIRSQKSSSEVSLSCFSAAPPPPPPPPPFVANLKPASERQLKPKTNSVNARDQLMEDIRNFKGFKTKN